VAPNKEQKMPNPFKFFAAITITCALAAPVAAQDVTADSVVASVNGTDITIGHMIVLRNNLPDQYQNLEDSVLFDGILDQVIQQTVLAQTIGTPSPAIALQIENERRALLAGAAMTGFIQDAITEETIESAYQERFADAATNREFNASHILVDTEEEANSLIEELRGGADFAELAAEKSTGPSGPNGGLLGWFGLGAMVPSFEAAVIGMQAGDVSEPVQTQFGWHVITLNEVRNEAIPTLDEVRADLAEELQQNVVAGILEDLTNAADVTRPDPSEFDPAIIRDTSLVQN
jgi:peptidyl-prolyl cis-trans isomerase C